MISDKSIMTKKPKRIIQKEIFIIAVVIFAAVFLAKFPTLYHWLNTPKGYWYPKQTSWYDAWDTNFQVSYMRFGQNHGMMLQNTYTTLPHKGVFIYQYYTFLGVLNRFLKLDPFVLYHLASIVTSIVLILVCYKLVNTFIKDKISRFGAFIMIVLGGGVGWIFQNYLSADRNLAGFTMVNAFERGHDALSTIFLLLTLFFQYKFFENHKKRYLLSNVLFGFFSITLHPPLAAVYVLAGLFFTVWEFKKYRSVKSIYLPAGIITVFIIYFLSVLRDLIYNPAFFSQVTQNLYSVDSASLFLGFGILTFFIFYGLTSDFRDEIKVTTLRIFLMLQLFLLLSPMGFHLYFAKGLHVWGVLLSVFAVEKLIAKKKVRNGVIILMTVFSLSARFYIFYDLMQDKLNNPFVFLTGMEGEAINFMSTLPKDKGILSLYEIGNHIPAHTDLRVYYGHKFQTPDAERTLRTAEKFYTSMKIDEQKKFLADNHISYIYYGLEEKELRKKAKSETVNLFKDFKTVYKNDLITIYAAGEN